MGNEQDRVDEWVGLLLRERPGRIYYHQPIEGTEDISSTEKSELIRALGEIGLETEQRISYPGTRIFITGKVLGSRSNFC